MKNERVEWIDIAKFIGIFAIYLGHFGDTAGYAYHFVFYFHVALFFFISGCMNTYDHETNVLHYIWHKCKKILLPFYGFSGLSIAVNIIMINMRLHDIKHCLVVVLRGCIRNSFFAGGIWFLSCLFMMEVIFKIIKLLKYKILMLIVSGGMFLVAELVMKPRPILEPHMVYNIDSVFYYIIFFAMGYCVYPYLEKLLILDTKIKRIVYVLLLVVTTIYAMLLFEEKSLLSILLASTVGGSLVVSVFQPVILIVFVIMVARLLVGIQLFAKMGRETLYMCGNEWIIKALFPMFLSLFGVNLNLSNPLVTYIYCFMLLVLNIYVMIPCEKKLIRIVCDNLCLKSIEK